MNIEKGRKINWKAFFICIFNNEIHTVSKKKLKNPFYYSLSFYSSCFCVECSLSSIRAVLCLVMLTCWSTEWDLNFKSIIYSARFFFFFSLRFSRVKSLRSSKKFQQRISKALIHSFFIHQISSSWGEKKLNIKAFCGKRS